MTLDPLHIDMIQHDAHMTAKRKGLNAIVVADDWQGGRLAFWTRHRRGAVWRGVASLAR